MKKNKVPVIKAVVGLLIILSLSAVFFYARIAVAIFAASNKIDISYRGLRARSLVDFEFTDLRAVRKNGGPGLASSNARFKLILSAPGAKGVTIDFILKKVNFITPGGSKEASYNNIDGLIAMPFSTLFNYREISGKITQSPDGLYIDGLKATGDSMKLSFTGLITRDNNIKADIGIFFEPKLAEKIPPELASMVLSNSDGGWRSLNVKLEGDLTKPSIQVTSKLFRLNIGVKPSSSS